MYTKTVIFTLILFRHASVNQRTKNIKNRNMFQYLFPGNALCSAWNPVCIGLVYGLIGKIQILPGEW